MTAPWPPSITATAELVVPRSIPMTFPGIRLSPLPDSLENKDRPIISVSQADFISVIHSYIGECLCAAFSNTYGCARGLAMRSCLVQSRIQAVLLPSEAGEFAEELGRFFAQ